MSELVLHVDTGFISPWALTAFVALEEKRLPYTLQFRDTSKKETFAPEYLARTQRIPSLQRGDFWLAESSAIAEYIAESFPYPNHPRIFPENLEQRGICRELQAWMRTDLNALREERPSTTVWGARATKPLSDAAKTAAERLFRALTPLIGKKVTLFDSWCIADVDVALALQRLNLNGDEVPAPLKAYAEANWLRPSVAKWNAMKR